MQKIYSFIEDNASTKNVLIGLSIILLFNTFLLPFLPYYLWDFKISLHEILDLKLSYSYEVYDMFDRINEKGRNSYKLAELLIDSPYAIIYGITYTIIVFMLLKANKLLRFKWLIFMPILIALFDLLENLCIVSMLEYYPIELHKVLLFSSTFTSLKWFFALLTFIVIMINILIYSANKIRNK